MVAKEKIKLHSQLLQVFAVYFKISPENLKKEIKKFLEDIGGLNENDNKSYVRKRQGEIEGKINDWWNGWRAIQPTTCKNLEPFFSKLADEHGRYWRPEWITTPLKGLNFSYEPLERIEQQILTPYAPTRIFNLSGGLEKYADIFNDKYRNKYFYIYRIHLVHKILVRDLLHIQECDERGNIVCKLYQYTEQELAGQEYQNVRTYNGSIFFNSEILYINLASYVTDKEHGPSYGTILFPRMKENKARLGVLTALSNGNGHPAAAKILIKYAEIEGLSEDKKARIKEMKNHVKDIGDIGCKDYPRLSIILSDSIEISDQNEDVIELNHLISKLRE